MNFLSKLILVETFFYCIKFLKTYRQSRDYNNIVNTLQGFTENFSLEVCTVSMNILKQGFSINFLQGPNCFDQNAEGPTAQNRRGPHAGITTVGCVGV